MKAIGTRMFAFEISSSLLGWYIYFSQRFYRKSRSGKVSFALRQRFGRVAHRLRPDARHLPDYSDGNFVCLSRRRDWHEEFLKKLAYRGVQGCCHNQLLELVGVIAQWSVVWNLTVELG